MSRIRLSLINGTVEGPYRCAECHNRYKKPPYAVNGKSNYWCVSCALIKGDFGKERNALGQPIQPSKKKKKKAAKQAFDESNKKPSQKQKKKKNIPPGRKAANKTSAYGHCTKCNELVYPKSRLGLHRCATTYQTHSVKSTTSPPMASRVIKGDFLQSKIENEKLRQKNARAYANQSQFYNPKSLKECRFCLQLVENRVLSRHIDYCVSNPSNHA
jgi:hypothetical protein